MIYRNSYWSKELRQGYTEKRISTRRKNAFGLFSGLISFVLFFTLQTLRESVLYDAVPEIMQTSYFSTVYLYLHLSFLLNMVYLMVYCDVLLFSEIRSNSWYLLIQLRHSAPAMIFLKLLSLILFVVQNYTAGFLLTVFLTVFLKYPFVVAYLPALYFSGLFDLVSLLILSAAVSLFVRNPGGSRWIPLFSAGIVKSMEAGTGYYAILSNRVTMQSFGSLFDLTQSVYLPVMAAAAAVCVLICVLRAGRLARCYHPADTPLPVSIGRIQPRTGKVAMESSRTKDPRHGKLLGAVSTVILIAVILVSLALNLFIIFTNAFTPGSEVEIAGRIPLIFQSSTMEPEIMKNDLIFFRRPETGRQLKAGQIILFEEDHVLYIEKILSQSGEDLTVDIDNYPPLSEVGAMRKTVQRADVHGIYSGRSRWLGALILFANTIIGRLVFLVAPAVLLFYRGQIAAVFKGKLSQ